MHVIDENVVIDRWRMDAIDRDTRRRRCDGATDEDARECVCAVTPRTSTFVSVDDRDALVETDGRIAHANRTHATDRPTDRDEKRYRHRDETVET